MDEETPPTPGDADAALDALGLHALADAPLGLELERLRADEPWCTIVVAGLQFYDYGLWDEVLSRPVIPELGDRLSLMRRPDNPADGHATEVWWRDGHHLGHVPRDVAAEIAPKLDAGTACRAYVLDPGDGRAWSLRMMLVGPAIGDLHRREIAGGLRRAAAAAAEAVWGREDATGFDPYARPRGSQGFDWWGGGEGSLRRSPRPRAPLPTQRQRAASEAWDARSAAAREAREAALIYTMHLLPEPRPPLPRVKRQGDFAEGTETPPDEALRGRTFAWWDEVPPWLATKTKLGEHGLRPRRGAVFFAAIEYGSGRRYRYYELWAVADCEAKRAVSAEASARAAEAAFWRRPEVEARRAERQEARAARARRR